MKALILTIILAGGAAVSVHAESFTFTSTSTLGDMVVAPNAGGPPIVAAFVTGTSATTFASGNKGTNTFSCASWTADKTSVFKTYGACTFTDQTGAKASIVSGCDYTNKEQTAQDCWGALTGLTGAAAGKTGTISWHAVNNADGKTGSSAGTGQWN